MSDLNHDPKFTPGPWKCIEVEFGDYQTGDVAFFVVASVNHYEMVGSVANCRLIAAAPDMYHALIDMIRDADSMGWNVENAKAAIAKAEGKSK